MENSTPQPIPVYECPRHSHHSGFLNRFHGIFPPLDTEAPLSLARTNYSPNSSQEYEEIANKVWVADQDIEKITALIAYLRNTTDALSSRLSNYTDYTQVQRSLFSPIRKLPNELLERIFEYVRSPLINVSDFSPGTIWDVLQVCALWRDIAQKSQFLWNAFERPYACGFSQSASSTHRIHLCLEYSKKSPLFISLSGKTDPDLIDALEDIWDNSERLVSLEIDTDIVNNALCYPDLQAQMEKLSLPVLKHIHISSSSGEQCNASDLDFLKSAITLGSISLFNIDMSGVTEIYWRNIRTLLLDGCDFSSEKQLDSLFREMPLLEELTWTSSKLLETPTKVIQLPSLHTLCVARGDYEDAESDLLLQHFPMLYTPNLTTLRITGEINQFSESLLSVVSRSSPCSIKKLAIHDAESANFILQALETFNEVEELELAGLYEEDRSSVLKRLIRAIRADNDPYTAQLLPSLKKLRFRMSVYRGSTMTQLAYILESRACTPRLAQEQTFNTAGLQSLEVQFYSDCPDDPATKNLKRLGRELGVEVIVKNGCS